MAEGRSSFGPASGRYRTSGTKKHRSRRRQLCSAGDQIEPSLEYAMTTKTLVTFASGLEIATGVALSLSPTFVVRVLFGAGLSDGGIAVGRVGGFALLSLATACWPHKDALAPATRAMFLFNLLTAVYLGYLKVGAGFVSYLLLPACLLHAVMAVLLARPVFQGGRAFESR
jgi:hypothetical protein